MGQRWGHSSMPPTGKRRGFLGLHLLQLMFAVLLCDVAPLLADGQGRYSVEPPVHQWIALQAYRKLLADRGATDLLVSELGNYLSTAEDNPHYLKTFTYSTNWAADTDAPYDSATALIEGICEEDKGTYDYGQVDRGTVARFLRHFWNSDGEYDSGLGTSYSALQQAQSHFSRAISEYEAGSKADAYYWLGRCAHLLGDMSVPAHVQLDPHAGDFLTGDDAYEQFTASWEHYRHTRAEDAVALPIVAYPRATPTDFNAGLTDLFYSMANYADQFDSDDVNGDSAEFGQGRFNSSACNYLNPDKTFQAAFLDPLFGSDRLLTAADYTYVNSSWSRDSALVYTPEFYNQINNTFDRIRVVYSDGTEETFNDLEDEGDVSWAVCGAIYQPRLMGRAISAIAKLYELFWTETATSRGSYSTLTWDVTDSGTIQRSPLGTDSTSPSASGSSSYAAGSTVTLTANPNTGAAFQQWTGDLLQSSSGGYWGTQYSIQDPYGSYTYIQLYCTLNISQTAYDQPDSVTFSISGAPEASVTAARSGNTVNLNITFQSDSGGPVHIMREPQRSSRVWLGSDTLNNVPPGSYSVIGHFYFTDGGGVIAYRSNTYLDQQQLGSFTIFDYQSSQTDVVLDQDRAVTAVFEGQATVPDPVFSPPSGITIPADGLSITLTCSDANARIWYNLLDAEPIPDSDNGSQQYTGSFTINDTATITARAFGDGFTPSGIVSAIYTASQQDQGAPEVVVTNTPPEIQNGDNNPTAAKATWFGEVEVGQSVIREFVIENTGTGTLQLTGNPPVQVSGAHSNEFEVTAQLDPNVPPGAAMEFTVRFTPSTTGTRSATVAINNSDADEGSFQFAIAGRSITPGRR